MSQERLKVLNMLSAGTITVEEADQLLNVLSAAERAETHPAHATHANHAQSGRADGPDHAGHASETPFSEFTFDQLLRMQHEGVEAELFVRLRELGLTHLSFDQVLQMSRSGIEPEFVAVARETVPDIHLSDVIKLAEAGVDEDFLNKLSELDLTGLSADEIAKMAQSGMEPESLSLLRKAGLKLKTKVSL